MKHEVNDFSYYFNKIHKYWMNKYVEGEITEGEFENKVDPLEEMEVWELKKECKYLGLGD